MKSYIAMIVGVLMMAGYPHELTQGQVSPVKLGPAFCSMAPSADEGPKELKVDEPDAETLALIARIVKVAGVQQNFVVKAYTRFNAEAQIISEADRPQRYIFYNREFLNSIRESGSGEWAELGILAHEVAHHLNGHTVENSFSTRDLELAADRSAGFWMGRLGATLEQAQSGFNSFPDIVPPGSSHPRRKDRLEAVKAGWEESGGGKPKSDLEGIKNFVDEADANMPNYFLNLRGEYRSKGKTTENWSYKGKIASLNGYPFECLLQTADQQKWELSCFTEFPNNGEGVKEFNKLVSYLRSSYPRIKWWQSPAAGSFYSAGESANGQIRAELLNEFLFIHFTPYFFPFRTNPPK